MDCHPPTRFTLNLSTLSWRVRVGTLLFITLFAGCSMMQTRSGGFASLYSQQHCVLSPETPMPEVVEHLNARTAQINAWRSSDVRISYSAPGVPRMPLAAKLTVQEPSQFRLSASVLGSQTFDLGSNNDQIWFWMKYSQPKHVFTCKHDDTKYVSELPFEPAWLLEVLGAVPLDPNTHRVMQHSESGLISLVTEEKTPQGQPVRKVILVDNCKGHVIAHELYDLNNVLIARAELNNYEVDKVSGLAMPHEISIDWPQTNMSMTLDIGRIHVNPSHIPVEIWQVPAHPNFPPLDIGAIARRNAPRNNRFNQTADSSPNWKQPQGATSPVNLRPDDELASSWDPFASEESPQPEKQASFQFNNARGNNRTIRETGASSLENWNPNFDQSGQPVELERASDWQPEFSDEDTFWNRLTAPQRRLWNFIRYGQSE